jgi:hypothetical protein
MGQAFSATLLLCLLLRSCRKHLPRSLCAGAFKWDIVYSPKSANESRIKENIDIFGWSMPEDLMAKFSEIKQACPIIAFSESCMFFDLLSYVSYKMM